MGTESEILIVDIETTDTDPQTGFIVELGGVALDLASGERRIVFDTVCREEGMTARERGAWIFSNSDLTVEAVRGADDLQGLLPVIQDYILCFPAGVTAYNNQFDFGFLESRGIRFPKKLACPMKLATDICKIPSRHPSHGRYKWPSVEEAWEHFFPDVEYVELHRGADDALHEAAIVYELYKMGIFTVEVCEYDQ